jgi:CubicO group peptidase (beta-lactamase class C family)
VSVSHFLGCALRNQSPLCPPLTEPRSSGATRMGKRPASDPCGGTGRSVRQPALSRPRRRPRARVTRPVRTGDDAPLIRRETVADEPDPSPSRGISSGRPQRQTEKTDHDALPLDAHPVPPQRWPTHRGQRNAREKGAGHRVAKNADGDVWKEGAMTKSASDAGFIAPDATSEELELIETARGFCRDALGAARAPGLSVAVALAGRLLWAEGYGSADLASGTPMTSRHRWRFGSFAKTYVATAVMQLVERGCLDLYDEVRQHVPELAICNPLGDREITVYDLLTYRGGLATDTPHQDWAAEPLEKHLSARYAIGRLPQYGGHRPLWSAKVGERYQYSNFGMATLGHLVERVNPERLDFARYVQQRIAGPLGLHGTRFPSSPDPADKSWRARLCTGYARFGSVCVPSPLLHSADGPAAALVGTPADQARWLTAFLRGGSLGGVRILEAATVALMTKPHVRMSDFAVEGSWNGLGFELLDVGTDAFNFGHDGANAWGWWSHSAAYPRDDLAVVVSTNCWDMTRYYNPPNETPVGLIGGFVYDWLQARGFARRRPYGNEPWPWRLSYAMGLLMAERTLGLLGASSAVALRELTSMLDGARTVAGASAGEWNPDAYCAGVADLQRVGSSPEAIRNFLESGGAPITASDLALVGLQLGSRAKLEVPLDFFAYPDPPAPTVGGST